VRHELRSAEVPEESSDDARDRYRTDIEPWRRLLRLRLVLVVLRGVRRVMRVAFVFVDTEPRLEIASEMAVLVLVVTARTVMVFGRGERHGCRSVRVLVKSEVQGQQQGLHQQAQRDHDSEESLDPLALV
jgi:hypothetical protein